MKTAKPRSAAPQGAKPKTARPRQGSRGQTIRVLPPEPLPDHVVDAVWAVVDCLSVEERSCLHAVQRTDAEDRLRRALRKLIPVSP